MAYEMKDNSASLFRNDKKESEKHPDYTGSAKVHGEEMWISAWVRETKDGRKYFSISLKPKEDKQQSRGGGGRDAFREERQRSAGPNVGGSWRDKPGRDEDIPFAWLLIAGVTALLSFAGSGVV